MKRRSNNIFNWYNKAIKSPSTTYLYTFDSNVLGDEYNTNNLHTIIPNDKESKDNFILRGLSYLNSNVVMVLSYKDNKREDIVDIKFKNINDNIVFDKSMDIKDGGTFTGQIIFYKFEILNKIINKWNSNYNNEHHYYKWNNYTELISNIHTLEN